MPEEEQTSFNQIFVNKQDFPDNEMLFNSMNKIGWCNLL